MFLYTLPPVTVLKIELYSVTLWNFTVKAKRMRDVPTHKVGLKQVLVLKCNVSDEHHLLEKINFCHAF